MCGFVSIISKSNFEDPDRVERSLIEMTSAITHRGPDAVGYYKNSWVALGFNRLSIIDLDERANQPMRDESGRYVIVFNGEVYNYIEIRRELTAHGHFFQTSSDTEVVLKAFIEWGEACLDKFTGMFAFLIIDLKERKFFAIRDPYGIKPLYFTETPNEFVFVSEIKSLLPFKKLQANPDVLFEAVAFRYSIADETLFRDVFQIQPGHFFYNDSGHSIKKKRYFELPEYCNENSFSGDEKTELDNIESLLREMVKIHTRSDVGYGLQLSGGVDSSLLTQFASEHTSKTLHTFSVSFPGTPFDESKYQKEVCDKLGTVHHDLPLDEELFVENLETCLWHYDFPLHDANNIPYYLLCKLARENGVKVLLSGDGADEVFHGYSKYFDIENSLSDVRSRLMLGWADSKYATPVLEKWRWSKMPRVLAYHPIINRNTMNHPHEVHRMMPESRIQYGRRVDLYSSYREHPRAAIAALDFHGYLQPWLTRADRMAMATSVEVRVPFCTVPLLKHLNGLPFSLKLKGNRVKYLLKKITEKYFSEELVWRRKVGFGLPIADWFRNKHGLGRYLDLLLDKSTRERGIFDFDVLTRVINEHLHKKADHSRLLWNVLNLELWYRTFIDMDFDSSNSVINQKSFTAEDARMKSYGRAGFEVETPILNKND